MNLLLVIFILFLADIDSSDKYRAFLPDGIVILYSSYSFYLILTKLLVSTKPGYTSGRGSCPRTGKYASNWQPGPGFTDLALAENDDRTRCASGFPGSLETSLPGSLHEGALRLKGEFRPSRISAPTGTGAIQIAPDPGKPGVFSVYNYIGRLNKKILLLLVSTKR
jgi:hypothetical protein